jgi:hypothetical protein
MQGDVEFLCLASITSAGIGRNGAARLLKRRCGKAKRGSTRHHSLHDRRTHVSSATRYPTPSFEPSLHGRALTIDTLRSTRDFQPVPTTTRCSKVGGLTFGKACRGTSGASEDCAARWRAPGSEPWLERRRWAESTPRGVSSKTRWSRPKGALCDRMGGGMEDCECRRCHCWTTRQSQGRPSSPPAPESTLRRRLWMSSAWSCTPRCSEPSPPRSSSRASACCFAIASPSPRSRQTHHCRAAVMLVVGASTDPRRCRCVSWTTWWAPPLTRRFLRR